jgi:transposase-like protein
VRWRHGQRSGGLIVSAAWRLRPSGAARSALAIRSRTYSAAYKARILAEYESLDKAGKGALRRGEGLYTSLISAWRLQRDQGVKEALARPAGRPPADPRDRENARLRRENERCRPGLIEVFADATRRGQS